MYDHLAKNHLNFINNEWKYPFNNEQKMYKFMPWTSQQNKDIMNNASKRKVICRTTESHDAFWYDTNKDGLTFFRLKGFVI